MLKCHFHLHGVHDSCPKPLSFRKRFWKDFYADECSFTLAASIALIFSVELIGSFPLRLICKNMPKVVDNHENLKLVYKVCSNFTRKTKVMDVFY